MIPHYAFIANFYRLPLAAIRVRRRYGESSWANLIVPDATLINPSQYIGTECVVLDTQGAEWLKATLTEIDIERDPYRATIMMAGRVINPPFSAASYVLTGVRERGRDSDGRHFVTCDPRPELRPNDSVNDGQATWIVHAIDLDLAPDTAAMRLRESV